VLGAARASAPADHPTLRYLQTGGDRLAAVPPTLPAPLWNIYGPTEAAIAATAGVVHPGDAVHIGGPLPGTRAYVLDPWLRPVPTGVPGELFLAGAGIALGYHGASGLTAQRFLPDVVAGDGSRMYRTGDLVRRGVDGTIAYLRRVDRQVKVRGQRIELGEIESVLAAVPGVAAAVVTLRDGALVAHYVAAGVDGPGEEDLRQQLGLRLPEAMLPTRYVLLDALPTTPNGKVDQAALPEPPAAGNGAAPAALDGPVQEIIADVWRELLPVETVSATDNFFALGGHSLLAARVATRLSDRFGLPVPLTQVFELPVLAHLAAAVEERVMAQVLAEQALSPQASEPA
jgi:arthrofactin-type cyclic lipopeptide synthetase A